MSDVYWGRGGSDITRRNTASNIQPSNGARLSSLSLSGIRHSIPQIPIGHNRVSDWFTLRFVHEIVALHVQNYVAGWFFCVTKLGIEAQRVGLAVGASE